MPKVSHVISHEYYLSSIIQRLNNNKKSALNDLISIQESINKSDLNQFKLAAKRLITALTAECSSNSESYYSRVDPGWKYFELVAMTLLIKRLNYLVDVENLPEVLRYFQVDQSTESVSIYERDEWKIKYTPHSISSALARKQLTLADDCFKSDIYLESMTQFLIEKLRGINLLEATKDGCSISQNVIMSIVIAFPVMIKGRRDYAFIRSKMLEIITALLKKHQDMQGLSVIIHEFRAQNIPDNRSNESFVFEFDAFEIPMEYWIARIDSALTQTNSFVKDKFSQFLSDCKVLGISVQDFLQHPTILASLIRLDLFTTYFEWFNKNDPINILPGDIILNLLPALAKAYKDNFPGLLQFIEKNHLRVGDEEHCAVLNLSPEADYFKILLLSGLNYRLFANSALSAVEQHPELVALVMFEAAVNQDAAVFQTFIEAKNNWNVETKQTKELSENSSVTMFGREDKKRRVDEESQLSFTTTVRFNLSKLFAYVKMKKVLHGDALYFAQNPQLLAEFLDKFNIFANAASTRTAFVTALNKLFNVEIVAAPAALTNETEVVDLRNQVSQLSHEVTTLKAQMSEMQNLLQMILQVNPGLLNNAEQATQSYRPN